MGTDETLVNYNGERVSHETAVQYAGDDHLLSRPHPAGFCPYGCGDGASTTPLADALAAVDRAAAGNGYTDQGEARPHLSRALWHLAEAVRASLAEFSEGDVRTLASAANELWFNDYKSASDEYLSNHQDAVLGKAQVVFGTATA